MTTGDHLVSLNSAAGREQWIHLVPLGDFGGRDGRGPYRVKDAGAVVLATREYHGKTQMAVDYDHQIDRAPATAGRAPAAGWIKGLQVRDTGIWGLVEWTEAAHAAIRAREYRYLSPVFRHSRDGTVTRLLRAALTNTPNLDLTALNSAGGDIMDILDELRQLLGLPSDADGATVVAKVKDLAEGGTAANSAVDPTRFVPIGDFERVVSELNRTRAGVTESEARHAVEAEVSAGRLPPYLRDWGIRTCTASKPVFDEFIKKTGPAVARLFTPQTPGHAPPGAGTGAGLSAEEEAVCATMGLSPDDYRKHGSAGR